MEKKVMKSLGVFGFFLLLVSFVSAYGVGSRFSTEMPLNAYPGQQLTVVLGLQNAIPTDGDMTFSAELTNDANGMVKLSYEDNTYFVPNGAEVDVPLIVTVPSNAVVGERYTARVSFRQVNPANQGGMVSLSGGMDYTFGVVIVASENQNSYYVAPEPVSQPEKSAKSNTIWYLLIGLVIVVILVLALSKKGKKK
jgi:hypothetical protein